MNGYFHDVLIIVSNKTWTSIRSRASPKVSIYWRVNEELGIETGESKTPVILRLPTNTLELQAGTTPSPMDGRGGGGMMKHWRNNAYQK